MTSEQSPFSAFRFTVTSERIAVTPWLNLPETLKQTLIQ